MADTILAPQTITRETLRLVHNKVKFVNRINRAYDERFAGSGANVGYSDKGGKIGPTLWIRSPVQWVTRSGATWVDQNVIENKIILTVSTLLGVDWDFDDVDLTLTIDDFSNRYLNSAGARLAGGLDYDAMSMYQQVFSQVGTPGTTPATALVYLQAAQKLNDFGTMDDEQRCVAINPAAQASTVDALKGLFQSSEGIKKQYNTGTMGIALGFDFFMTQNVRRHTTGSFGGTPVVNGASQGISSGFADTTSLVTSGWPNSITGVLLKGDTLTLAGVNAVNPENKADNGVLMQFVVTANANSGASTGPLTAILSPAIISGGAYQNVTALPASGAAIVPAGTLSTAYPINLAFHKDAFTCVTADLYLPKGTDMASRVKSDGISLRFIRDFDTKNNARICRFDVLYGFVAQQPRMACRIIG